MTNSINLNDSHRLLLMKSYRVCKALALVSFNGLIFFCNFIVLTWIVRKKKNTDPRFLIHLFYDLLCIESRAFWVSYKHLHGGGWGVSITIKIFSFFSYVLVDHNFQDPSNSITPSPPHSY